MAYDANQLWSTGSNRPKGLRAWATSIMPKTFAGGTGTLKKLTPVAFNTSTNFWQVWTASKNQKTLLDAAGTVSGGTLTITVEGETTATIAYDAAPAAVKSALEALGGVEVGDVAVSGTTIDADDVVIEFKGNFAARAVDISVDDSSITGGGTVTTTQNQAAVGDTERDQIRGFVWPDEVVLVSGKEVLGQVMLAGKVHYDDIVLPDGEVEADLKTALRDGPRDRGLHIQGLDQVR